jgi:hypothetical protein
MSLSQVDFGVGERGGELEGVKRRKGITSGVDQ